MPTAPKHDAPRKRVPTRTPTVPVRPVAVPSGDTGLAFGGHDGGRGSTGQQVVGRDAKDNSELRGVDPGQGRVPRLDVGDVRPSAVEDARKVGLGEAAGLPGLADSVSNVTVCVHVSHANLSVDRGQVPPIDERVDFLVGANVRSRRKAAGLTQDILAKAIGVHRTRVVQLEGGDGWTLAQVDAAARSLGYRQQQDFIRQWKK